MKDTPDRYGAVSRLFHWSMALAVFALFVLGWWMVGLDYYSPYYKSAPDLHRSFGMILLAGLVLRMVWRAANVKPESNDLPALERRAARVVHAAFYPLLALLMISGYVISTADGRPIEVFGWFNVPALGEAKGLEDGAGLVHEWTAYAVIGLAIVHSAAAIKHKVIDRHATGTRMW